MTLTRFLLSSALVGTVALSACGSNDGDGATTDPPTTDAGGAVDTEPPATEPPPTGAVVTEPSVTDPVTTDPPTTEPPVTEAPTTEPASTDASDTDAAAEDLSAVSGAALPADLDAGRYAIASVSVPMEFDLPEPMRLQANGGRLVVLAPATEGDQARNLVVIADASGWAGANDIADRKSAATDRASDVADLLPPSVPPTEWAESSTEIEVEARGMLDVGGAEVPWFDMRIAEGVESYRCDLGPVCINTIHHPIEGYFEAGPSLRFRVYDLAALEDGDGGPSRPVVMVQSRSADQDAMNALGDSLVESISVT